jgi:hypothetical protein
MLTYAESVLELVEDETVNALVCSWHDYGTHALVGKKKGRNKIKKAGKSLSAPSKTTAHTLYLQKKAKIRKKSVCV